MKMDGSNNSTIYYPMKLIVRTPVSQRMVTVESLDDLDGVIKEAFKIDKYQLFSDPARTKALDASRVSDGGLIYMSYDIKEPKIYKEENKCTHSPDAVCPKCASLDPLDRRFNDGIKVKYLSYASYREMLKENNKKEDEYDYALRECDDHPKNVKCMKCMDKVITLVPQIFRRIDYVEFDNKGNLEAFINRWRSSGKQQIGLLIGKYEDYELYPMGRKAVVSGIWEIHQERFPDGAVLDSIPKQFICPELSILGVIYTDLFMRDGSLFSYKRSKGYIVSALELNFFYDVQASIGATEFDSVCVSPDESLDISLECFQISEQFQALMRARALSLTTDCTVFETQRDISYSIKNEYDKSVSIKAHPFVPVDYFIVKCESGCKENPLFENPTIVEKNTLRKLSGYFGSDYSFYKFKSFNILMHLAEHLGSAGELISAVVRNDEAAFEGIKQTGEFKKLYSELQSFNETKWSCSACTYSNEAFADNCEMCSNPK